MPKLLPYSERMQEQNGYLFRINGIQLPLSRSVGARRAEAFLLCTEVVAAEIATEDSSR